MDILEAYNAIFQNDLLADVLSDTSGDFSKILVALLTNTNEFFAREVYSALHGWRVNDDTLIEILCTKSSYDICEIAVAFNKIFSKSLATSIEQKTSGALRNLMLLLYHNNRDNSINSNAHCDALVVKSAFIETPQEEREAILMRIFTRRNSEQIRSIEQEYAKLTGRILEFDIKQNFTGKVQQALIALLKVAINPPEFFAHCLHRSMIGLGTDDKSLIRLVVTRSEIDMEDVKVEFLKKYGKSLKSFIKGDTSGCYRKALLVLIGEKNR